MVPARSTVPHHRQFARRKLLGQAANKELGPFLGSHPPVQHRHRAVAPGYRATAMLTVRRRRCVQKHELSMQDPVGGEGTVRWRAHEPVLAIRLLRTGGGRRLLDEPSWADLELGSGQGETDPAAFALRNPDQPAVGADQSPGDGQTQPGPTIGAATGIVGPGRHLERMTAELGGKAPATIAHLHQPTRFDLHPTRRPVRTPRTCRTGRTCRTMRYGMIITRAGVMGGIDSQPR